MVPTFDGRSRSFAFYVSGDTTQQIPLELGASLVVEISRWDQTPTLITFTLALRVDLPFGLPSIPVATTPVSIPVGGAARSRVLLRRVISRRNSMVRGVS